MVKIHDKRFFKYINLTKNDMHDLGHTDFEKELKNILETKSLTIGNISSLLIFLHYRHNNPEHYKQEFDAGLMCGKSFSEMSNSIKALKKEHKYMYRIIKKSFSITEPSPNFYEIVSYGGGGINE